MGLNIPVFEKLTQQQLGYFWRPEEVSLQKDRSDYQNLTEEQKHIFTSNLKYQIMLDSVQGRAPGMAFAPYCSLPELEACMNVWQFMEMIHSRSYTYIIKNVYSDPAEVFDTILKDEKILERAESVTSSYDDFVNDAHEYDSGNLWKYAVEGHPTGTYDRHELKRKTLQGNRQRQYSGREYDSMCHLRAHLHSVNSKLMEGSAKIISLISRDENQHVVVTQQILNKWNEGDDPEMKQIAEEERENTIRMFKKTVDEEKQWAKYLFKNGSMIGLNDKLLGNYVEWIANRRMKAIGLKTNL